ncbi:potassium channel family protein [Vibrio splendidus]|uniref:potassium channel family protein n=1 Tax=Vibrio splendidus TaxID=29497 RepID=UPI000CB94CE9|nr:potassium channel family protein [Vibrio splendidus]PMH14966.1 hypothetical protein BCU77_23185 [Vibrio splendidus]
MSLDTNIKIMRPHKKDHLTTSLGRRIDSMSYINLLIATVSIWFAAGLYFFFATYYKQGMNIDPNCIIEKSKDCIDLSWGEVLSSAMYFSGVTLTTLGYGDISPIGFGRVVAVLLAVSGLTIVALLIAKISSERQSSLLLLLHTSDVERRVSDFVMQIDSYTTFILESSKDQNTDLTYKNLRGLRSLLEAVNSYITFHVNQAMFLEIGTEPAIKSLMSKMGDVHPVLESLSTMAVATEKIENNCLNISKRMGDIERFLIVQNEHKGKKVKNIDIAQLVRKHERLKQKYNATFTELKVIKVRRLLPNTEREQWPQKLNRQISDELGISAQMVKRCINELKSRGEC